MKRIAIVGSGFGGVNTALHLLKSPVSRDIEIAIFSRDDHFLFTPLLLSATVGILEEEDVIFRLEDLLGKKVTLYQELVRKIDFRKKIVYAKNIQYDYDYIVVSLGATSNFFGIPGAQENCSTLKSIKDCEETKRKVELALDAYTVEPTKDVSLVVIGGGTTGIELAFDLHDMVRGYMKRNRIKGYQRKVKVIILEGRDRILPVIRNEKIRMIVLNRLKKRQIELRMGCKVVNVIPGSVELEGGERIDSQSIFWTAGIKPNTVETEPIVADKTGHIPVDSDLRIKGAENAFCIGDCALFYNEGETSPIPDFAQVAVKQAKVAASNIIAGLKGTEPMRFRYVSEGIIISLGRKDAIAEIRGMVFTGKIAAVMHRIVYTMKLFGLKRKIRVGRKLFFSLF